MRAEGKQILNLVFLGERAAIDGEEQGQPASRLLMKKLCEFRNPALLNAILHETAGGICRSQAREGRLNPLFKGSLIGHHNATWSIALRPLQIVLAGRPVEPSKMPRAQCPGA